MTQSIVGLDLGGTNIKAALVVLAAGTPEVARTLTRPTDGHVGPHAVVERLAQAAGAVADTGDPSARGFERVGVTVPGTYDASTGTVLTLPNLPGWEGVPIVDLLSTRLNAPVTLLNDSQAFTLAEGLVGAGRGKRVVAGLTLGTGIGGGILIDGRLHVGASGSAGEFGHQTIEFDGPPCGCGQRGCLEALARPPVVAADAGQPDFEATIAAYRAGDQRARAAMEAMVEHLGAGVANILTMLGPDRVVVGGGAAQAGATLIEPIRAATIRRVSLVGIEAIDIVAASLGHEAGAIGAALLATDP